MKRTHLGLLAAAGSAIGIAVALVGLPYGRLEYAAFAGLYHNNGTPAPGFHVAIDCNASSAAVEEACTYSPFTSQLDVAVTIGNNTGSAADISAFGFEVVNPDTSVLVAPDQPFDPIFDRNPDFNQGNLSSAGWGCTLLGLPVADNEDPDNQATQHSRLICFNENALGDPLPAGSAHVELAKVTYNNVYPPSPVASAPVLLTLEDVLVHDSSGIELLSCNPVIINEGQCFGATISIAGTIIGCPDDHDCDGFRDRFSGPPPNHVGPQNFNANYDNCPTTMPNADQGNTDGNWIDLTPPRGFDDMTRIMSDAFGDRCDTDLDNDGLLNPFNAASPEDISSCPLATAITAAEDADSDNDLYLDGAECALGTDPTDPLSKPSLTQCGAVSDGDGDGILAAREVCFFNSSDGSVNSDSLGPYTDPWTDGCEVASVNADTVVNVLDLQAVAGHFPTGTFGYHENMDMNKDAVVNVLDLQFVASRAMAC